MTTETPLSSDTPLEVEEDTALDASYTVSSNRETVEKPGLVPALCEAEMASLRGK
jgi:hypothetical protein